VSAPPCRAKARWCSYERQRTGRRRRIRVPTDQAAGRVRTGTGRQGLLDPWIIQVFSLCLSWVEVIHVAIRAQGFAARSAGGSGMVGSDRDGSVRCSSAIEHSLANALMVSTGTTGRPKASPVRWWALVAALAPTGQHLHDFQPMTASGGPLRPSAAIVGACPHPVCVLPSMPAADRAAR